MKYKCIRSFTSVRTNRTYVLLDEINRTEYNSLPTAEQSNFQLIADEQPTQSNYTRPSDQDSNAATPFDASQINPDNWLNDEKAQDDDSNFGGFGGGDGGGAGAGGSWDNDNGGSNNDSGSSDYGSNDSGSFNND
jgi:hypothetical protein